MTTPAIWLAKEGVCTRCRWDEMFVEDLLSGAQKRPATLPAVEHFEVNGWVRSPWERMVVMLPGGNHIEDVGWVNEALSSVDEVILFITSDEGSHFPIHELSHPNLKLWIMTPRPEIQYPVGTQFLGEGSGRAWRHAWKAPKVHRAMLAAQNVRVRARSLPRPVARTVAAIVDGIWSGLGLQATPPVTRMSVKMMGEEVTLDDTKARRELGYVGLMSFEDGMRAMREAPSAG